jgi:tRNA-Thr(GGU) m(6)t(6)A37 methyltransferase TsaA
MSDWVPIGWVVNAIPFGTESVDWKQVRSQIRIESQYVEGLYGLDPFSHIYVIFLLEDGEMRLRVHPCRRDDLPEVGLFASRSPHRPNPLGLTLVRLLSVEGNILHVHGLDAFDGTEVLDIKPFQLKRLPQELKMPAWTDLL